METKYTDIISAYGKGNVKQLGNKILAYNGYEYIYGYEIKEYNGLKPKTLHNRVYTDMSNVGRDWDKAYDMLFGSPIYSL